MTGIALRMWAHAESVDGAAAGKGASRQGRSSTRSRCACLLAALWHFCLEAPVQHAGCVCAAARVDAAHVGLRQSLSLSWPPLLVMMA